MNELLYLTCPPRTAPLLVDELMDKLEEANIPARIVRYGVTTKAHDGFIILACEQGFPQDFIKRLHHDQDVSDYLVCSDDDPSQQKPGATGEEAQL